MPSLHTSNSVNFILSNLVKEFFNNGLVLGTFENSVRLINRKKNAYTMRVGLYDQYTINPSKGKEYSTTPKFKQQWNYLEKLKYI